MTDVGTSDLSQDFRAVRSMAPQAAQNREWDQLVGAKGPQVSQPPEQQNQEKPEGEQPGLFHSVVPIGAKIIGGAWSAVKDVGKGVIESPLQVTGGTIDYGNNLFKFADTVVKHAENAGLPNVYVRFFDKEGNWDPAIQSTEEFRKAQAEGRDDVFQMPTTGAADSVTGNIIRTGTTFLVGRGKITSAFGGEANAPLAARLLADFVSGATGQKVDQERLSNAIDQVAPNFVTDWLKAKPEDEGTLLGHLKSGLEYAGIGALFAGVKEGLGKLKGMISGGAPENLSDIPQGNLGKVAGPVAKVEGTPLGAGVKDAFPLGDATKPAIEITGDIAKQADDFLAGRGGENSLKLNLARIGSSDDIQMTLRQVSSMLPDRAPQSHEATVALADSLGLSPDQFISGYQGGQLNASETTAMRFMLDSSASQLQAFASKAIDPATATPDAKAQFLRAFATHRALQQYAEGARNEAGRTLNAWGIMSQQRSTYSKAIDEIVKQTGEQDTTQLMQRLAELNDPQKVSQLVGQASRLPGRDGIVYGYYNTLLSYKTVVKKAVSDVAQGMWNIATRWTAENYGSEQGVAQGETAALTKGYIDSLGDGFRAFKAALKAGESQFYGQNQTMDALRTTRLAALANGSPESIPLDQPTAAGWQYLRTAMPTSWIGAIDDMAKTMNYRAELSALAQRTGAAKGLEGDALADFVEGIKANPPVNIHQQAVDAAMRTTFQEPLTGIAAKLQAARDSFNIPVAHTSYEIPAGRILLPFTKIPANIVSTAYRNSPLPLMFPSKGFQSEIAAGGAAKDIAMARIWLGSAAALTTADLAIMRYATGNGPSDPGLRQAWLAAGNQPYSFQFPGMRPISYRSGIEPFGMMIGTIADTVNTMQFARDQDRHNIATSFIFGAGQAMLSKTYMEGLANFLDALHTPDQNGDRWTQNLMASLTVPNVVSDIGKGTDDWVRAHYGYLDSIENKLPIVRQNLPPARTLWGDPVPLSDAFLPGLSDTGVARVLSPFTLGMKPEDVQPIDKWMWDNRAAFPRGDDQRLGIRKIGESQSFAIAPGISVPVLLEPEEVDRYQYLAGQGVKDSNGMGAKDVLNALVKGTYGGSMQDQWNKSSPELNALTVQKVVNKFRAAAKQQLRQEFPRIEEIIQAGAQDRAAALSGGQ